MNKTISCLGYVESLECVEFEELIMKNGLVIQL